MGMEMVASHVPLLVRMFTLTKGDVLEIGTGYFSTLILKWLSEMSGRKIFSYENRLHWYNKAKLKETDKHKVFLSAQQDYSDVNIDRKWGLAFVDGWPNNKRIDVIKRLANKAEYIVIHDTNLEDSIYQYSKIWNLFKYRYDFKLYEPHTTVVSNFHTLTKVK